MPKSFSAYERCSLCEAGWRSRVTPLKLPDWWQPRKRGSDARQRQIPESTGIISNSPRKRISALSRCFVRQDWSITAAGLSSKESSTRSSSSSNATLRRCSSSPGWTTFISNFKSSGTTVRPSRWYNKYSDGKLLGKCSLKITYHQPTYLKGKPDRECSMSGVNHKSVSYRTATEWGDERQIWG